MVSRPWSNRSGIDSPVSCMTTKTVPRSARKSIAFAGLSSRFCLMRDAKRGDGVVLGAGRQIDERLHGRELS